MTVTFDEDKQDKRLDEYRKKEEEDIAQILAERHGMEYVDLMPVPINMDALRLIPEAEALDAKIAGFSLIGKRIKVAVVSPVNPKTMHVIDRLTVAGYDVTLAVASPTSLAKAWARYKDLSFSTETKAGALEVSSEEIKSFLAEIHTIEDVKKNILEIIKLKKGFRISKILEIVLSGALATKASDIHIEPEEDYARLRYRLDGVLTDIASFDLETFGLILSRIKLLSGLKLNIKSEAQDGRFSVHIADDIEIRTSILPGAYNESIVLRLLNPKSIQVPLEELGIPKKLLSVLMSEIDKPNGMVLTTGPTGSGKTTTLYAFLRKVYNPGVKIITIEDPIEYHLPGIVQTQVNTDKDYTFALGLRSALRQDPDIIMVGEIRDEETAKIAIDSAETGHLVFSTLHTNSAAGSFPRLLDLGVNPKTLTSAINIAIAQRLVRKLCEKCKKERPVTADEKKYISEMFTSISDPSAIVGVQREKLWDSVGCPLCNGSGYRGRIGIYEAVLTDEALEEAVRGKASEREIKKATRGQGILSMEEDGVIKALSGVTAFDELRRVIELTVEE
jgi:type IV pilus assembly protein PilB